MFSKILAAAASLTASSAMAVQFTCTFTEPFATIKYDTETNQMQVDAAHSKAKPVLENLNIKLVTLDRFDVVSPSGQTLMQIIPDGKGSDGMSDRVFPYSAILTLPLEIVQIENLGGPLHGGCETNLIKATEN